MIVIPKVEDQMIAKCPYCKTYFICSCAELDEDIETQKHYICCPNETCRKKISPYSCHAMAGILPYIL